MPELLSNIEAEIIDEFSMFDDWMDKYEYLIELGKDLPAIDPNAKNEMNLVKGCQSQVWVDADLQDGLMIYTADSDAIITKGMIALLLRVFSGQTPETVMSAELPFLAEIGLRDHLSPNRKNGLDAMIKRIKNFANQFNMRQL